MPEESTRSRVSIVTPAYNQADYLAATIDSVLEQDYPNLEYLVLDDGSTDHTPAVLSQYEGRVRHERHVNMGQSNTLNKGWTMLTGDYLGYLSADDLFLPQAVSVLADALDANPDVVVVYGDFHLIDASGQIVKKLQTNEFRLEDMTEELMCTPGVGALFRRSVFEATGGWNSELRKLPDFEFWLRASRMGRFMRVPVPVGLYRVHEESTAVRPVPVGHSMEIVDTMHRYWKGEEHQAAARYSLSRAHYRAAQSHAQSGRLLTAAREFVRAVAYHPRTAVSRAAWVGLMNAALIRVVNKSGWLTAKLR